MFLDWKNQYCGNDYTTQNNIPIQCNLYQITNGIFHNTRTKKCIICIEIQKTPNSQRNLEKQKQSWRTQSPWLQTILQSYGKQDSMVLAQEQKYRSMEQDRKPRYKPTQLGQLIYNKRDKNIQRRKCSLHCIFLYKWFWENWTAIYKRMN